MRRRLPTQASLAVLWMTADGYSQKEISRELGISRRSVRMYLVWACYDLGAVNNANAIAIALAKGLIPDVNYAA